jgi:DNA-damage-inducible protein D
MKRILMLALKVSKTIHEFGGTMPEKLPTPQNSVKKLEKRQEKLKPD